jgi:GR25 family glycosyltransferase involved in LPS biosynthesis
VLLSSSVSKGGEISRVVWAPARVLECSSDKIDRCWPMPEQVRIPTFIVNLRGDTEKLARALAQFEGHPRYDVVRLEGVYGSALPDDVCRKITSDPNSVLAKGALGCFLTHVRAWDLVASRNLPLALVVEDDVELRHLSAFDPGIIPPNIDLLFANDRAEIPAQNKIEQAFTLHPIAQSLPRIEQRRRSIGTDCYFISPTGATKLIAAASRDLYGGHVDVKMLSYSIVAEDLESLPEDGRLRPVLARFLARHKKPGLLNTFSLFPAIGVHPPVKDSSRLREDRLGATGDPEMLSA